MAQALKKGEIDFADNLPPNVFKSLQGVDGITTVPAVYSGSTSSRSTPARRCRTARRSVTATRCSRT